MDYDRRNNSKYLILYHIILVTKYRHNILNLFDIKTIFKDACSHTRKYASFDSSIEAEDYYLEKYTNEIPDYFKKFKK
jgi:REP element-mobilizing transposase RayT